MAREQRATDLAIQGWAQTRIAADLGISQAAVSKLLKRVDARTLREMTDHVARHKLRQTQRLDHIVAESLQAWEASKGDNTRRRQRKTDRIDGNGHTVVELVAEAQHGDPRYLDEARKALADLRKLWGLEAPQRVDVRAVRNPYAEWSDEALATELARQVQLLKSGSDRDSDVGVVTDGATTSDEPTS